MATNQDGEGPQISQISLREEGQMAEAEKIPVCETCGAPWPQGPGAKRYVIGQQDAADEAKFDQRRLCEGYEVLELIGVLYLILTEILYQMQGIIRPSHIQREVADRVKGAKAAGTGKPGASRGRRA